MVDPGLTQIEISFGSTCGTEITHFNFRPLTRGLLKSVWKNCVTSQSTDSLDP